MLPVEVVGSTIAEVDQRRSSVVPGRQKVRRSKRKDAAEDRDLIWCDGARDEYSNFIIYWREHTFKKIRVHLHILPISVVLVR